MTLEPPEGFSIRPVAPSDAKAVADAINETTRAEHRPSLDHTGGGAPNGRGQTTNSLADALLVDESGKAVGYLQLWCDIAPYDELLSPCPSDLDTGPKA